MTAFKPAFPWARSLDADQLAAFLEELWGAAGGEDDLRTLKAVENVIATWRMDVGDTDPTPPLCPLSPRELQILTQLANGETYESAAENLTISAHSVRARCPQIYARLGAKNAAQAAAIAAHHGWLPGLHVPEPASPAPRLSPTAWNDIYRERAAEMRGKPGLPLEIGPYGSRSGARGAVRCIRKGLYDAFQPAGAFDARRVRTDDGTWIVRARYLGTPASTTEKAS